jgi:hypothetical protein
MSLALGTDEETIFSDLLDTVAGQPGDVVVLIKSFSDESYDNAILCVAGYTMTSPQARALDTAWGRMLSQYRLPYFRMSACNARQEPFDHLTEQECIAVATEAIALIGQHVAFGYAVTVDQKAFRKVITSKGFVRTPYEMALWLTLTGVTLQRAKHIANPGKSAFFFEAGFQHQGQANQMMERIFNAPQIRDRHNYKSHSFVEKEESRPTQAADLLSWQWYKNAVRVRQGRTRPRGDLLALFRSAPHYLIDVTEDRLLRLVERLNQMSGSDFGNELAGMALRDPDHPMFPKRKGETGSLEALQNFRRGLGR